MTASLSLSPSDHSTAQRAQHSEHSTATNAKANASASGREPMMRRKIGKKQRFRPVTGVPEKEERKVETSP